MSKRVFTTQGLTFTAAAAGSAIATSSTYMAIAGSSASGVTQVIDVLEVLISGMQSASTVASMFLARASTLQTGAISLAAPHSDGGENPNITALSSASVPIVPQSFDAAATTQPTPSNATTDAKLNLSLNLFGGIIRWNAAPTQQWWIVGGAAPGGESVLWAATTAGGQSGIANAHIIYEPY